MSRRRLKRNAIGENFAWRTIAMLESPAYRELSHAAHRAMARLEIELSSHGGKDNGRLVCTFGDFEKYGVRRHSIGPGLRELVALGFIEVTEQGRAGNGEYRKPNRFRLTWRDTEDAPRTDDWKRIPTVAEARTLAEAARRASPKPTTRRGRNQNASARNGTEPGDATAPEIASSEVTERHHCPGVDAAPLSTFTVQGPAAIPFDPTDDSTALTLDHFERVGARLFNLARGAKGVRERVS
jgi:hypothetical protein